MFKNIDHIKKHLDLFAIFHILMKKYFNRILKNISRGDELTEFGYSSTCSEQRSIVLNNLH